MLRSQLAQKAATSAQLQEAVDKAKVIEAKAKEDFRVAKEAKRRRHNKVTRQLQTAVRGWLARRRLMEAISAHMSEQRGLAGKQPDVLKAQLTELQHDVHSLLYTEESRVAAILKLQSWWRAVLAKRVVRLMWFVTQTHLVHKEMQQAAVKIQAWLRGRMIFLALREEIKLRLKATYIRRYNEMETALLGIVRAQRAVRAWRARKAMRELRRQAEERRASKQARRGSKGPARQGLPAADKQLAAEDDTVYVDTWKKRDALGAVTEERPKTPREIQELNEAGLVPFYGAYASERVRHKVGGPSALKMHRRLFQDGSDAGTSDESDSEEPLGDAWDVYPKGLSHGFMEELDADAWPKGKKPAHLRKRSSRRKRDSSSKNVQSLRPTMVLQQPPGNSEHRAQQREDAKRQLEAEAAALVKRREAEPHPLLQNAPTLQQTQPRRKSAKQGKLAIGVPDCTWQTHVGFYGQKHKKSSQGSAAAWPASSWNGSAASPLVI